MSPEAAGWVLSGILLACLLILFLPECLEMGCLSGPDCPTRVGNLLSPSISLKDREPGGLCLSLLHKNLSDFKLVPFEATCGAEWPHLPSCLSISLSGIPCHSLAQCPSLLLSLLFPMGKTLRNCLPCGLERTGFIYQTFKNFKNLFYHAGNLSDLCSATPVPHPWPHPSPGRCSGFSFVGWLLLEERAFYPASPVDSLIHLFPVSSLIIAACTQMTTAL